MSRSNDAGHFFQTTDALATTQRKAAKAKNKHGDPIKLPSKILAAHLDPYSVDTPAIFVAEAAGEVKRVHLESGKIDRIFTQGNAPLTCLALCPQPRTLFAGSWDKTIYAIPLDDPPSQPVRQFRGHTDFVKCLQTATLSDTPILLSGSADTTIIVWDIARGAALHKLQTHTQALQTLSLDPETPMSSADAAGLTLFAASSAPEIRQFDVRLDAPPAETPASAERPIRAHETSVYALAWDGGGDVWSASADKTAKHLVRARGWEADTVLGHGDFVRDVVVCEARGLVVTACRDEDVRVWDASSGELVCCYGGHYDEVSALVLLLDGRTVASVGIDGTVRRWSLDRGEMAKYREAVEREARGEVEEVVTTKEGMLTVEEEAELAELMDDDDE